MKKNIEAVQGSDVYPAGQQMLIHQGKVLKDETTLEENKVAEKSFVVIMLTKVICCLLSGEAASPTPLLHCNFVSHMVFVQARYYNVPQI